MSLESGRKQAWHFVRLGLGWLLTLVGVTLLFLPGPGVLFLLPGVTLLSAESLWVRRLLRRVREQRHIRRAMREAERAGFRIDPGPDDDHPGDAGPSRPGSGS